MKWYTSSLRSAGEQAGEGRRAVDGVEEVLLVDADPGQGPAHGRQLVATPGVILFRIEQPQPRLQVLLLGAGRVVCHRDDPFCGVVVFPAG